MAHSGPIALKVRGLKLDEKRTSTEAASRLTSSPADRCGRRWAIPLLIVLQIAFDCLPQNLIASQRMDLFKLLALRPTIVRRLKWTDRLVWLRATFRYGSRHFTCESAVGWLKRVFTRPNLETSGPKLGTNHLAI
jgi:hypothetical protein